MIWRDCLNRIFVIDGNGAKSRGVAEKAPRKYKKNPARKDLPKERVLIQT
jgi:hypothetical protein